MNRWEKEVQRSLLKDEVKVIKSLEKCYENALTDVNAKILAYKERLEKDGTDTAALYQKKYQEQIKAQIEGSLKALQDNNYTEISKYLEKCYENSYIGTLYDIQNQGVPIIVPINQENMVRAITTNSKISKGLYTRLGVNSDYLKKVIAKEFTRGVVSSARWEDIANQIKLKTKIGYSNAVRIARTEGGRIQTEADIHAMREAKKRGADIVKIWDAMLDGRTRYNHLFLDGQTVECEEYFTYPGGKVFAPHDFGIACEDINCRCTLDKKARWLLDDEYTKYLANVEEMDEQHQQFISAKLNMTVDEMKKYSDSIVTVKADSYKDFKRQFYEITEKMAKPHKYNGTMWQKEGTHISKEDYEFLMSRAKQKGIKLVSFENFDGDVSLIHEMINNAETVLKDFPKLAKGKTRLQIHNSYKLSDEDFAETKGNKVFINNYAFRNAELLASEYKKLEDEKWFVEGTDSSSIIFHELGHVVKNIYQISVRDILNERSILFYGNALSDYSASYQDGREIISEVFSSVYSSNSHNKIALNLFKKCVKLILKKGGA